MAEAILYGVAQKMIENLGSQIFQEIGSLWGVQDELDNIKSIVSRIQAVLQDAAEQQSQSNQVRDWLEKLKDAIYEADDLLSEFSTEASRRRAMSGNKITKEVRTFFSKSNQLAFRHEMSCKIKAMRKKLDAIAKENRDFNLKVHLPEKYSVSIERETHSFVPNEKVIGREDDKEAIINLLLDPNVEVNVSVVSIVGIGGLGKTTLAQYVYNDETVNTHFELKMWVCVSDDFEQLRQNIDGKKYLLVLDDVWNESHNKWDSLKSLLMGGAKGSKIVITTRAKLVAEITESVSIHTLTGLSEDQSWSLFKQIVFRKGQETNNPKLEEIGREILGKCQGVPLAIKSIGSVLCLEKTEAKWSYVKDNILVNVLQSGEDILPILKLSYDHLPSHLKSCFAYCSLFPKDYVIDKETLDTTMDSTRVYPIIKPTIRAEILKNYLEILKNWSTSGTLDNSNCDALSHMPSGIEQLTCLQTLSLFVVSKDPPSISKHVAGLGELNGLNNLRGTLEIKHLELLEDANAESKAANLREKHHLENLILDWDLENRCRYLPPFSQLPSLKRLYVASMKDLEYISERDISEEVSASFFPSLNSLEISGCPNLKGWWRSASTPDHQQHQHHQTLPSFPLLSSLGYFGSCPNLISMPLFPNLEKLLYLYANASLKPLQQTMAMASSLPSSSSSSSPFSKLKVMILWELKDEVSLSDELASNLNSLKRIQDCDEFDPVSDVDDDGMEWRLLNSLRSLILKGLPKLKSLPAGLQHLTTLRELVIAEFPNLMNLPEWTCQLTSLEILVIAKCPNLSSLPDGIRSLRLQKLTIHDCPHLEIKCEKGIGEDWPKIAHVPKITHEDPSPKFHMVMGCITQILSTNIWEADVTKNELEAQNKMRSKYLSIFRILWTSATRQQLR
uniref:Uncharacterized protein n=1 Tax=Fagus sylvatica TaxID=28930 RepID=A0A2N9J4C1_FAGSY